MILSKDSLEKESRVYAFTSIFFEINLAFFLYQMFFFNRVLRAMFTFYFFTGGGHILEESKIISR